jgi:hypothetical protein
MDSKKSNRRGFLKGGAALAGLAAAGAQAGKGQTQGTPPKKVDELIAYGERSRFVTSIRVPVAERHSPDEFGLTFHVLACQWRIAKLALSAVVFEVLIPLPGCATSLSYSFI